MEDERLRQQAVAERERGNALFKAGKYDLAVEKYTAGHYFVTQPLPLGSVLSCPVLQEQYTLLGFFYPWDSSINFYIKNFEIVNLAFFRY